MLPTTGKQSPSPAEYNPRYNVVLPRKAEHLLGSRPSSANHMGRTPGPGCYEPRFNSKLIGTGKTEPAFTMGPRWRPDAIGERRPSPHGGLPPASLGLPTRSPRPTLCPMYT